ncbi:apolipoprotein N-acyltransferase [Terriglobus tenax]|uniref:apolipoprotein N-acyltransferase n=1 Tax=Terriglobus tenax TaxID=1111115 RepID=UPI0021E04FDB|nr:apolipoprotein N-acyltransferase [Terriglobus tenax]
MRGVPGRVWALVLASGVLQVLLFPIAGPVPVWRAALSWVALAPLLVALLGGKPLRVRDFALAGYACGILWYLGSCYWVMPTMYLYGGMSKPAGFGILLLFALYLGLYHALFGALLGVLRRFLSPENTLLASPFVWVAVELARARITSFPWDQLGIAQVDNAVLTSLAPWGGVYAISFVLVAVNVALAWAWMEKKWRIAVGVLGVAAVIQVAGMFRNTPVATHEVATLVQPNLSESQRYGAASLLQELVPLSQQGSSAGSKIILWPESPAPFATSDKNFLQAIAALASATHSAAIIGSEGVEVDGLPPRGYKAYNSAALFAADGSYRGRYDKIHLVPFGEYLPFASIFQFAGGLVAEVGESDRGHLRTVFRPDGHGYGIFICYESIFADEVRQFVKNGADVLVNISNDGWYGDTSAPWQHLNMARMRAIENHRWVLRDTNNGMTGAIDPDGNLRQHAERHIRTAIAVGFGYSDQLTFYTKYGDVFAYGCSLLVIGVLLWGVNKQQVAS